MTTAESRPPVAPGEPAPDFTLPAVDGEEIVSLADYRGRSPVFLALMVGLWCPFCRRQIAQMGATEGKLKAEGVETLGVVATRRRTPGSTSSSARRACASPPIPSSPRTAPTACRGLPRPRSSCRRSRRHGSIPPASCRSRCPSRRRPRLAKMDGYADNQTDQADMERQWPQLKAQFLIDRDGIVRWANIECATEGLAGIGKIPSDEEILAAARALPRR